MSPKAEPRQGPNYLRPSLLLGLSVAALCVWWALTPPPTTSELSQSVKLVNGLSTRRSGDQEADVGKAVEPPLPHPPLGTRPERMDLERDIFASMGQVDASSTLESRLMRSSELAAEFAGLPAPPVAVREPGQTLVVFLFHDSGAEHAQRLRLFLRLALAEGDGTRTWLAVPEGRQSALASEMPALPSSAQWVGYAAGCAHDSWGLLAAVASRVDAESWENLVVISSHAAGPFLPAHVRSAMHWTEAFTRPLNASVGLVAAGLSCEGAPRGGDAGAEWRLEPALSRWAWAADRAAWQVLVREGRILRCHEDRWAAVFDGDAGAVAALLGAGRTVHALLAKFQGVDWRDEGSWRCNDRVPPHRHGLYDGLTPDPLETVFSPIALAQAEGYPELRALYKHALWAMEGTGDVKLNEFQGTRAFIQPPVLELEWSVRGTSAHRWRTNMRGDACFDHDFYERTYPDMKALRSSCMSQICSFSMFDHFMLVGTFQARRFKFTCPPAALSRDQVMALAIYQGRACFDAEAYRASWADLGWLASDRDVWAHWLQHGQFEGRKGPRRCPDTLYSLARGPDGTSAADMLAEMRALVAEFVKPEPSLWPGVRSERDVEGDDSRGKVAGRVEDEPGEDEKEAAEKEGARRDEGRVREEESAAGAQGKEEGAEAEGRRGEGAKAEDQEAEGAATSEGKNGAEGAEASKAERGDAEAAEAGSAGGEEGTGAASAQGGKSASEEAQLTQEIAAKMGGASEIGDMQ